MSFVRTQIITAFTNLLLKNENSDLTNEDYAKNMFEIPCLVLSSFNFFILGLTLLYLIMKNHLLNFKPWEQLTLYCFFLSQTLRLLSWLYVYLSEHSGSDTTNNTPQELLILSLLDDLATLLAWGVLMYFVFSILELRVVLESQTSKAMVRGLGRSKKMRIDVRLNRHGR